MSKVSDALPAPTPADHSGYDRIMLRTRPGIRMAKFLFRIFPRFGERFSRWWYRLVSRGAGDGSFLCMNYGYAPLDPAEDGGPPEIAGRPQGNCLRLYHRVVADVDLEGKAVLEVGSGRGGGTSFVKEYFRPHRLTGLDLADEAVAFCNRHYQAEGLDFVQGSADALPFPDESFDAVINVESSHGYPSLEGFLAEVVRVLRPGGHLMLADLRPIGQSAGLSRAIVASGLEIIDRERIADNVRRALELDSEEKRARIRATVPRLLHPAILNFAAVSGSPIYEAFQNGRLDYWRFVARKPGGSPSVAGPVAATQAG